MTSVPFSSMAGAMLRRKSRCNDVGFYNLRRQLRIRNERYYHQHHSCLRDSTASNRTMNIRINCILTGSYSSDIEKLKVVTRRYRLAVRNLTTTTSSSSSISSKYIKHGDNHSNNDIISSSESFVLPHASKDNESFKVTKINTETGEIKTIQMLQTEIVMQTTLSPRDLVSLRLTSKKERREDWIGNTLIEQMRYPPTIMARNDFILLSLGPVRAVAERHVVFVFDVHNKAARSFTRYLSLMYQKRSDRIKNISSSEINENQSITYKEEPTELVFLEAVLADTIDSFSSRIRIFEPIVNDLLLRLSTDEEFSDANLVHQMAPLIEQLKSFQIYVTQAYDCLMQILNDDEAMLQLLLTEQTRKFAEHP